MPVDPQVQSPSLTEQKQPSLPPPIDAVDVGEGVRAIAGDESEKPEESTAPSPIDVAVPPLPRPFLYPLPKRGYPRRKKKLLTHKQSSTANRRLEILSDNFHPVPFSPGKTLDFSAHEKIFRALGLWEFAHLELDSDVRSELLTHLIAYYDPANRRSYVNGTRISVSRSDLARALGLPAKKEKLSPLNCTDEAVFVLLEFISNYMPYGDDMCILPQEISQAIQFVKNGLPQKVDWAGLMWVLVEKDLLDAPNSGVFHCASHLQCLIKHQHPHLFLNEEHPMLEPIAEVDEEEISEVEADVGVADAVVNMVEVEVTAAKEDEYDYSDSSPRKMRSLKDLENAVLDKNNSDLPLNLSASEHLVSGYEDEKAGEEEQWLEEMEHDGFEHCLPHCSSGIVEGIEFKNFTKVDEQEGHEMKYEDDPSLKFPNSRRQSPSDFLHAVGSASIPYFQQSNSFNADGGEFLTVGAESHKNKLSHGPNYCLHFGNNGKRHACAVVDPVEDHFEGNQQKKMRTGEPSSNLPLSPYELMEQLQQHTQRLNMIYAERTQAIVNMEMQAQYLSHILPEKEQAVHSLKMMVEEQQHWRMVVRHYEHELDLITKMLLGYKKALKETQISFADYKRKHSLDDETLSKDVPGTGGLVLSASELAQQQLDKEEATRRKLLDTFGIFEKVLMNLKECEERIMMHNKKLVGLAREVKQLKKRFANSISSCI
ncbi:hypothetical protein KSP40_PGU012829 [Platanthera guangdongensis]|uniref:Uncharacterized protein n=1 Tax=Platanthera guangdongensis TaxID=2320717 RepID=A0ABR2M1V9_9ASPA